MNEWLPYESGAELYAQVGEDDPVWRQCQRSRFLEHFKGDTIADIGCGPGYDLAAFAALGFKTIGIDGSPAMLALAAQQSPKTAFLNQDLRSSLPAPVDGLWSMFALIHLPERDLAACFNAWRNGMTDDGPLALGLVESAVLSTREVKGWLGQDSLTCTFFYHKSQFVEQLLVQAGFRIERISWDIPARYRGGIYDELQLKPYVIFGRKIGGA